MARIDYKKELKHIYTASVRQPAFVEVPVARLISKAHARERAALLAPRRRVTPQLEARFAERFPGRVLVSLHSGLTPAQRLRRVELPLQLEIRRRDQIALAPHCVTLEVL